MSVKDLDKQIEMLEKQLEQEKVNLALQLEINRLKLQAFEEDIREQNNSQLLNGQCCLKTTAALDFPTSSVILVAMSEILQETTVWKSESPVPNHIYLLDNNSNIIAYIKQGDKAIIQLKSKIKLDKRYRKFIKVNHTGLSKLMPKDNGHDYSIKPNVRIFKVISGNHDYKIEVNGDSLSCTCIGYGYRGKCKHIEAVKSKL